MLKLNVGLSRKVGEANYGSRGASVHLELEVESALAGDPSTLQDRIRSMFRLARASVDEELAGSDSTNGHVNTSQGHHSSGGNGNGARRTNGRHATASQVRAIHAIANRQRLDLIGELRDRYGVEQPEDLSIGEASELIDSIKPQTNGNGGRR